MPVCARKQERTCLFMDDQFTIGLEQAHDFCVSRVCRVAGIAEVLAVVTFSLCNQWLIHYRYPAHLACSYACICPLPFLMLFNLLNNVLRGPFRGRMRLFPFAQSFQVLLHSSKFMPFDKDRQFLPQFFWWEKVVSLFQCLVQQVIAAAIKNASAECVSYISMRVRCDCVALIQPVFLNLIVLRGENFYNIAGIQYAVKLSFAVVDKRFDRVYAGGRVEGEGEVEGGCPLWQADGGAIFAIDGDGCRYSG